MGPAIAACCFECVLRWFDYTTAAASRLFLPWLQKCSCCSIHITTDKSIQCYNRWWCSINVTFAAVTDEATIASTAAAILIQGNNSVYVAAFVAAVFSMLLPLQHVWATYSELVLPLFQLSCCFCFNIHTVVSATYVLLLIHIHIHTATIFLLLL